MIEQSYQRLAAVFRRMVFAFALLPLCVAAQESCTAGVVFGFFNGVQTTEQLAKFVAHRQLVELYGPTTPAGESITYDLFYNDTQGFADFVETFDQRLQEHGGLLAGRFELFFSAARGEGFWWKALTSAIPSLVGFLEDLFDLFRAALMRELTNGLGTPNTGEVAARHRDQIDLWAGSQKKMLFFAHSQGNLFVNRAYAHAVSRTDANAVKVVHVAPASPILSGSHTLADKDMVINALRLVGAVAPNTTEIAAYLGRPAGLNGQRDLIGHGLLEIYLNPALATAGRVREHVLTALRELDALAPKPMPPFPDLVETPWLGGHRPLDVYGPLDASHRVDKAIHETTVPQVFVRTTSGWLKRSVEYPRKYAETWRFLGLGMGGYQMCEWDDHPYPDGDGALHQKECTYERVFTSAVFHFDSLEPDEVMSRHDAPVGTVLSLTTLTFSNPNISFFGAVEFFSGYERAWNQHQWHYWWEPYQINGLGPWLNEPEIRAWDAAADAYRQEENRRYERYSAEKEKYDELRRRCASSST